MDIPKTQEQIDSFYRKYFNAHYFANSSEDRNEVARANESLSELEKLMADPEFPALDENGKLIEAAQP